MSLIIAIPKTTSAGEKRVAASPDTVKKFTAAGFKVVIQSDAGKSASVTDNMFSDAGAKIAKTAADTLKSADIILCVQPPTKPELAHVKKGAFIIGNLSPYTNQDLFTQCAKDGIHAMAMELVPRITRAQAMDVLSSQANLMGYKAVLDATEHFARAMPMMMTAAGTVPPAKVFVMGAGVAGLQAIATAKRLGAVVSATDVRPAAKEQVQSLGGSFIAVEDEEFKQAETAGGYAKEMSADYKKKQAALIAETIAKQDIVITTALIPGRKAPILITAKMVASMKPGSVLIDLAAPQGGNVEGTKPGDVVEKDGVIIVGHDNVPSRIAATASSLYAKNLMNLVMLLVDADTGALAVNWDDDIVKGVALTKDGQVIHPMFADSKKKAPAKKATTATKTGAKKTPPKKTPVKKTPVKKAVAKKPAPKKTATKTN